MADPTPTPLPTWNDVLDERPGGRRVLDKGDGERRAFVEFEGGERVEVDPSKPYREPKRAPVILDFWDRIARSLGIPREAAIAQARAHLAELDR